MNPTDVLLGSRTDRGGGRDGYGSGRSPSARTDSLAGSSNGFSGDAGYNSDPGILFTSLSQNQLSMIANAFVLLTPC